MAALIEYVSWKTVSCFVQHHELFICGHTNGDISMVTLDEGEMFRKSVHSSQVTCVVVIDYYFGFVRLSTSDKCGTIHTYNVTWDERHSDTGQESSDFHYESNSKIVAMSSGFPKSPSLYVVDCGGVVKSINWRTGEVRQLILFRNDINDLECGLEYDNRTDYLYVSLMTKTGLKLIIADSVTMRLLKLCHIKSPTWVLSPQWTRLMWYCNRFLLCYSSKFVIVLDPISQCSLKVIEMGSNEFLLFLTVYFVDVSFVIKATNSATAGIPCVSFRVISDILFDGIRKATISDTSSTHEVQETSVDNTQDGGNVFKIDDSEAIPDDSDNEKKSSDFVIEQQTANSDSFMSNSDSLPPLEDGFYPKLTEWVEGTVDNEPRVLMGQYASDSHIPSSMQSDNCDRNKDDDFDLNKQHGYSFSNQPTLDEPEPTDMPTPQPIGSSLRPSISADDRLMKLFFPADYDNECPFPSQPVESDENLVTEEIEEPIVEEMTPEEEERENSVPSVNFLDYWPIWLDMPLLWTSSLTSTGPAAAIFGSQRPTSISMSKYYIYVTDNTSKLSYASLDCKTVRWQIAMDASSADQVSVSPQGDILWLLRAGSVYAAQMVSGSMPVGSRWERILLDVSFIHVSDGRAFYIRRDGALMMQSGLSQRRSSYVSVQLQTPFRFKAVVVAGLDIWGHCADGRVAFNPRLLSNSSAKAHNAQMMRRDSSYAGDWQVDNQCPPDASRISGLFAGPFNTVLVADEFCRLWIHRSSISPSVCIADYLFPVSKSKSSCDWWMIPLPKNQDEPVENVSKLWPLFAVGFKDSLIVTAPSMATGALQLYLSKGRLLGQQLRRLRPNGSALTTRWRSVHLVEPSRPEMDEENADSASMATTVISSTPYRRPFAWLVGETGDLLKLDFTTLNTINPSPVYIRSSSVKVVSVGKNVTWVLLDGGTVWACHHESEVDRWIQLDLTQLAPENLPVIDVAVGPKLVWILSNTGKLFFRIGTQALLPSGAVAQPALCQLTDEVASSEDDIRLRRIYASPTADWMVFALPAPGSHNPQPVLRSKQALPEEAYDLTPLARMGISEDVPIGALWHPVIGGPPMRELALSAKAGVFGIPDISIGSQSHRGLATLAKLDPSPPPQSTPNLSVVYWRAGVRHQDPTGSYWRRIIDGVSQMSASDNHGQLCLIGNDGSLYVHAVCCFANGLNQHDEHSRSKKNKDMSMALSGGWEVI